MSEDVVVTGMGIVSPIGCGEAAFWDALCTGRSGAAPVDCLDTSQLTRSIACQVREPLDVDASMGRASRLAVTAARQAVANAGLNPADVEGDRLSVIIGTTMGETEFIEARLYDPDEQWLSQTHLKEIAQGKPGVIARRVLEDTAAKGCAVDLYGACAAGNMALAAACRGLLTNQYDVVLAGGSDGFSRLAFLGFMRLRVMAAEVCRPFDEERDGLFVGEGSAIFVLERESTAKARGARIRARIVGSSVTCEDYHPTRPSPDGDGLHRATMAALHQAGLKPEDIDYICAHGTGTPQNDKIEVKVMQDCFPTGVPFSSIKALTGHTMGATAAIEAAACVLAMERRKLFPTWNLKKPICTEPLDAIKDGVREAEIQYALNNSAGFGGYNSSVILASS